MLFPQCSFSWPGRKQGLKCSVVVTVETLPVRWSKIPTGDWWWYQWLSTKRRKSSRKEGSFLASYTLQVFSYQLANTCLYPRKRLSFLPTTSCGKSFIQKKKKNKNNPTKHQTKNKTEKKKKNLEKNWEFKQGCDLNDSMHFLSPDEACNTAPGVSSISDDQTSSQNCPGCSATCLPIYF